MINEVKQWELLARLEKTIKNGSLSFDIKIASLEYLLLKYREESDKDCKCMYVSACTIEQKCTTGRTK